MIKVMILGAGNLAFHLTNEILNNPTIQLVQVYNRNIEKLNYLKGKTEITNQLSDILDADVYIICVSDAAILNLSKELKLQDKLVVHTSGAMHINEIKSDANKGVFYPLQSFSKDKKVDFLNTPICIEAENNKDLYLLETLANSISNKVYHINSIQRKKLHVSAVFVNNFVNHLYYIGNEICDDNQIPFEILSPLIQETAAKIESLSPYIAQTGPAKRNDIKTIQEHLKILNKKQQAIYSLLTKSIEATYGKKL